MKTKNKSATNRARYPLPASDLAFSSATVNGGIANASNAEDRAASRQQRLLEKITYTGCEETYVTLVVALINTYLM